MHIYDYIIIGSGLTGLSIAKKLREETANIAVLEAQEVCGGSNRSVQLQQHTINNGLRFLPGSSAAKNAVDFMEALLSKKITDKSTCDNIIETYEASGFKKFVGFGEKSPEFYDQLSYFLNSTEIKLTSQPFEWVQMLAESLADVIQKKSIVTRFGFENSETDKPVLTHVIVNGTKTFHARNFIFAGPVKDLVLLLPDEVLNARAKAKLKKSTAWQSVSLDLYHELSLEKDNLFLLNGTTDDDIGPCIGRFLPTTDTTGQISQWTSFVDSESAEDTENIGLVLKKMKRQIKRAFPEIADTIKKERISVSPPLSGADLKLNANGTLPKIDNLWIASAQVSPYPNILGSLMQARLILSSLGFGHLAEEELPTHTEAKADFAGSEAELIAEV